MSSKEQSWSAISSGRQQRVQRKDQELEEGNEGEENKV